jgi:hypothetical protein
MLPRPSSTLQIKGKKRHLLVDTQGLLLCAIVHAADIQDRDGGVMLMGALFGLFPFLRKRSVGATLLALERLAPDVVIDGGRRDGRPARDCKGRSYEWSYERSR